MYGDDAGGDEASVSDAPMTFLDAGDGGAACMPLRCSEDLHSLLDCNGNVVQTCAPTDGCSKTGCVPACDAVSSNPSSRGCDFYAVHPAINYPANSYEKCFAAIVANTWNAPISLSVEFNGNTYKGSDIGRLGSGTTYSALPNGMLPVGQAAILFLSASANAACPAPAALDASPYPNRAFHITASAPVSAYSVTPYTDYKSNENPLGSGTLLLPSTTWGTNYVSMGAYDTTYVWGPFIQFVAKEDQTSVKLGAPIAGNHVLSRGEILTVAAPTGGVIVQSTKPIGVWAGHQGMVVDTSTSGGGAGGPNAEDEQLVPIKMLGSEYAVAPVRSRQSTEALMYRIVGAVDGTTLTYTPMAPTGAPATIQSGKSVYFESKTAFVVKSQDAQHPFYLGQYQPTLRPGSGYDGAELANVVPPAQFLSSYVFYAVPGLSDTNLVVVRQKGTNGFADVTLDCAGKLSGWQALGDYEWTRVDLVKDAMKQGSCDNGRHEITSDAPFGINVWSWQTWVNGGLINGNYLETESYGYTGGLGLREINTVTVPPPN